MPPFIGEIRMFAGNFNPAGWMFCEGQLLPISEYDTLFELIGTTYGGDGQETFGLPDLSSRVPVHQGNGVNMGEQNGAESVTVAYQQIPTHTHAVQASADNATASTAGGNVLAQIPSYTPYIAGFVPNIALSPATISPAGGSQPHSNLQPYGCVNFIISLFGIFPST
jgi:microcystin-dependent protein